MKKFILLIMVLLPILASAQVKKNYTNSGKFRFANTDSVAEVDGTAWYKFTINATTSPAQNAQVNAGLFEYNWRKGDNQTFTGVALEGVARSQGKDEAATLRGVYGRFYIDPESTATLRTGIGGEFSARASYNGGTKIGAESGTAFVGARIWMAPWFDGTSMANINNFHGLWIYNEHDSADVTNGIYINSASGGGSYTNFLHFVNAAGGDIFKVTKTGAIAASIYLADTASFDGTAIRKAIYIPGATANDVYSLSIRNTSEVLPVADDELSYYAKTDSLVANRKAGTTASLKWSYIRMKH